MSGERFALVVVFDVVVRIGSIPLPAVLCFPLEGAAAEEIGGVDLETTNGPSGRLAKE